MYITDHQSKENQTAEANGQNNLCRNWEIKIGLEKLEHTALSQNKSMGPRLFYNSNNFNIRLTNMHIN